MVWLGEAEIYVNAAEENLEGRSSISCPKRDDRSSYFFLSPGRETQADTLAYHLLLGLC